jgi:hypothetical protein
LHIYNAGIQPNTDIRETNRLHLMNTFYSICSLVALFYCAYYVLIDIDVVTFGIVFVSGFLFRMVVHFNRRHLYALANVIGIVTTGIVVFGVSIGEGFTEGFSLYYLITPLMTLSFFSTFNRRILLATFVFYGSLFGLLIYAYHNDFTNEPMTPGITNILLFNFVAVFVFIFYFIYNFKSITEKFFKDLNQQRHQIELQNETLLSQNETLQTQNQKIDALITSLNDKVKNNMQIMSILGEMDSFSNTNLSHSDYTKLYLMRLKILDLSYKMTYEQQILPQQYYNYFLNEYAKEVQKAMHAYMGKVSITANDNNDIDATNTKRFDATMILYNEIILHTFFQLNKDCRFSTAFQYNCEKNSSSHLLFTIENLTEKDASDLNITPIQSRFAKSQGIDISNTYANGLFSIQFMMPN